MLGFIQILGGNKNIRQNSREGRRMSSAPKINLKVMKQRLLDRRKELEHVIESRAETQTESELDQQRIGRLSRMDALQAQAMAKAAGERREIMLRRISAALTRLDRGEYGRCQSCEEPIHPKRLEVDPTAPLCTACAQQAETRAP